MCAIFDYINVVCLKKMMKPSQDIIIWQYKLDHKLAITYSYACSSIKYVDSILLIKTLKIWQRLGYCFTPYQRLRLYNGAPFSRLLRHAGDTEDVFSA